MNFFLLLFSFIFGFESLTTPILNRIHQGNHASYEQGTYNIKRSKRKRDSVSPMVIGNFYDFKSKKRLAQLAIFMIDGQVIQADKNGYYEKTIREGSHNIIGRNIFYKNVYINNFKVFQGDSITINFFLVGQETVN